MSWRVAGFIVGLVLAAFLVGLWLMLTGGAADSLTARIRITPAASDRGLIGSTYTDIAQRLAGERNVVRPVRGNLDFRVQDIVWQDLAGPTFARAAELRGRLDTRAAGRLDIIVRGANLRDADVYVAQGPDQQWNYRRVLDRLLGEREADGPERSFIVYDFAAQNVDVQVERPEQSFAIRDVAGHLPRIDFAAPGLRAPRVALARATGTLVAADSTYPLSAQNGQLEFETGQMNFTIARITTGATVIADFTGAWGANYPGYGLLGEGRVENLRFQDVRFASPRLPAVGTAAFGFRVIPVSSELTEVRLSDARMESEGSKVTGSAAVRFGVRRFSLEAIDARFEPLDLALVEKLMGDTLPYQGTITGTARGTDGIVLFDVATRLVSRTVREPLIARVTGSARVASDGFELRRVETTLRDAPLASLRGLIPGMPLAGNVSGRIALSGPPGGGPLTLDMRTELAGGVAVVGGTIDISGTVPRYDLDGRIIALNLQQLLRPAAPPAFVTARFSVQGAGADPNTLDARVHVEGRFTGWRSGPHDTIHVAARVRNGTVLIDSAAVRLATMTAEASGEWRFAAPASGALDYTIAFEPVTPFGPYIPFIGDDDAAGSIRLAGTVTGTTGHIQVAGTATAGDFVVGEWSTQSLEARYGIVVGPAVPEFTLEASARELRTPTAGAYSNARATVKLQSPVFALDVRADRASGQGGLEVVADGRIPIAGAREVVLQRARVDFGSENWALTRPAVFSWAGPETDLNVRSFELRRSDNNGLLQVEGRLLPLANADFRVESVALPVGDLQHLFGIRPLASGALSTSTSVRAIAGVPRVATTFRLDGAIVEDVHFSQLSGDINYADQRLTANATARVDTAGSLVVHAELPLDLRFGDSTSAHLLDSGPVNVTAISEGIALAPFAALSPDISDLSGTLVTNIRVGGTVQEPVLSGTLDVRNAAAHVVTTNQTYDSINARIILENQAALIQNLAVRSGGTMRATGSVEFRELDRPLLDITAYMSRFELLGVDNRDDARTSGSVHLVGPLSATVLTGALTIEDGYFPLPQTGASALDAELARFEADLPAPGDEPASTPFYDGLRIDNLRITAGNNLWFAMEDARAELAGTLVVNKNGETVRVTGDLEGERGTYVLRAGPIVRRFEVSHAYIRFLGDEELNPSVDITARRRVIDQNGRQIDIDVRIGGTLLSPTLGLASETAAPIPQSELLSFLLFGQPSFALGAGSALRQDILTETVVGGISELVSLELEQAVIDQLGTSFDVFEIRLGGGRLEQFAPSLVLGEEIAPNVFLTVESVVKSLFHAAEGATTSFGVHLEWRITEHTTLRGSREPVNEFGLLRSYTVAQPALRTRYQTTVELRRRWTW